MSHVHEKQLPTISWLDETFLRYPYNLDDFHLHIFIEAILIYKKKLVIVYLYFLPKLIPIPRFGQNSQNYIFSKFF